MLIYDWMLPILVSTMYEYFRQFCYWVSSVMELEEENIIYYKKYMIPHPDDMHLNLQYPIELSESIASFVS